MISCVIMHNMIVEDEREDEILDQGFHFHDENDVPKQEGVAMFGQFIQVHHEMCDWATHIHLQHDLVEHMWAHIGNQ